METPAGDAPSLSHSDPEIADALRAAASTEGLLGELLPRLSGHLDEVPPGEDAWSAVETVGQLLDIEVAYGHHLRCILSQDSPQLARFDEEALITAEHWRASDLPTLLTAWAGLRRAHLALIARLDADALGRGGVEGEDGPVTARGLVLQLPILDRAHLNQLRRLEEIFLHPPV